MNKEKDWVFNLERQIVNNLKQQITNIDVNNILHYNQTGEIKEVSYVPVISNSLVYLWNEIEEKVANSFFSNVLDLAEFNDGDIKRLETIISYLEEEKALETDKKKKLFKEIEIKKYKQQLNTLKGGAINNVSKAKNIQEITDPIEYDTLEKKLKRGDISSSEKAQIKRQLKVYDDKMDKLLLETENLEDLESKNKQDIKEAKKAKEIRVEDNKEQYTLEELKAIQKAQATKGKTFSTAFSVSPYMRTRINNLSKILDANIREGEDTKEDKIKRYKKIVRLVNTEVKEKNYSLKQSLEKEITIEANANEDRKKRLKRLLTGGIRNKPLVTQIERVIDQKSFNFEKLESIYRSQLRNPDLTKKQKETISDLLADLSREGKRNQISTIFSNLKELGNREQKIERIIVTEMTAAYNIATFLSNPKVEYFKWSIEPEHERRNAVCLVCYERANGGYLNKGVYPREQIENNIELFIPKHPYCLCRYIPVTKGNNPDLFSLLENMTPEQKQGYEGAMDNWVNLSNNWSKLGAVAKGSALTALSIASLWLAAKRFKKLGEVIEKGSKGFVKLKNIIVGESDVSRSPQQVVNAITREGGILPPRPQYGLGEVDQITPQNIETVIQDTNEGTRMILENVEREKPQLLQTVLSGVGIGVKIAELPDELLESLEVVDIVANHRAETKQMIAPLDVELEGVKPEYQNFPMDEFYEELENKQKVPYDLPVLNDLAEQVVKQFTRTHSKEVLEIKEFLNFIEGSNIDEINDLGEIDNLINILIQKQKEIRTLIRNVPKEVLSSKNKSSKDRFMSFNVNGEDVGFPFKGKDREGKAIGFVQEIIKGSNSNIIRDNALGFLTEDERTLKSIREQAENRRLRIMETEGIINLQNERVFYDPLTQKLETNISIVVESLTKDILEDPLFANLKNITKQEELDNLIEIYQDSLRRNLRGTPRENLPIEIQTQLNKIERQINERRYFISNSYLLKPSDISFNEMMDIIIEKEGIDITGVKLKNKDEDVLLNFLDNFSFANNYLKIVEDLDYKGYTPEQIKEALLNPKVNNYLGNIKENLTYLDTNKSKVNKYIQNQRLEVETRIRFLESLENTPQILLRDRGGITEDSIRKEITETLMKLRTRQSFLNEKELAIFRYFKLKEDLMSNPTSYMNRERRLGALTTINKDLNPVNKKFKTTTEKVIYLKQQITDLITEQQTIKDRKKIDEIENKIKVLTEEIRKVQIAEFRRYEIEKNNNYIQYLSVKDNVLFSKIFMDKLK